MAYVTGLLLMYIQEEEVSTIELPCINQYKFTIQYSNYSVVSLSQ